MLFLVSFLLLVLGCYCGTSWGIDGEEEEEDNEDFFEDED